MQTIPDEYMQQIKAELEIQKETDDLNSNLSNVAAEINSIFQKYGITNKIAPQEIMFGKKHFGNRILINWDIITRERVFVYVPKLSDIIFDHYYPKPKSSEFYHFTTLDSALKILGSGHFRVYNLMKNYSFDEFRTFYTDHNLSGYNTNVAPDGDKYEDHIMKQTFSLCLTNKKSLLPHQEDFLWQVFGSNYNGVKLEIEVNSSHPDFREIFYKDKKTSINDLLLNELTEHFQKKYNRQFALSKISKIGGFYLPSGYEIENETRFLIKEHTDDYSFNFNSQSDANGDVYIELPFQNPYALFQIKKIHLGKTCDVGKATTEFNKIGYDHLLIKP